MKKFLLIIILIFLNITAVFAEPPRRWQFFPVSVHIEQNPKKPIIEKAFADWQRETGIAKFMYFRSEKQIPNIIVKFSDNNTSTNVIGVTHSYFPNGYYATAKITIWLNKPGNASIMTDTEIYSTALHEIGHALGLVHSPNKNDIMYFQATGLQTLSPNDIAVFKQKYSIK